MKDKKPKVFMITPFKEDFLDLYAELKNSFSQNFEFNTAGDLDNQQNILKDIVNGINDADIVIADVTGLNSNVFYELGIAHAMDKKVILITQDIGELPFDIKAYRATEYSLIFNKIHLLKDELTKLLNGAINGSIKYSNPVSDFLLDRKIPTKEEQKEKLDITFESEERGFVDLISDIEEDGEKLTRELYDMTDSLNKISSHINHTSNEINTLKSRENNITYSFIRNLCVKLALPLDDASNIVQEKSKMISLYWERMENNFLSLLDNKFMLRTTNIEALKSTVIQLKDLQVRIAGSKDKFGYLVIMLKGALGLERNLNKSIISFINGIEVFLKETETMHSSIDRIINKSNMIVKQVENNTVI